MYPALAGRFFTTTATWEALNDLNQIPYDYRVEVRNRLKGLDMVDRVLEELWMEVHVPSVYLCFCSLPEEADPERYC